MVEEKKEPIKASAASEKDIEENKFMAFLSYLGILFLIPLLAKKDSPYCQFHAKQGFVLFIAMIVAQLGWFIFWIPFLGWLLAAAVYLFLFILWLIGVINVFSGKTAPLPVIGQFAEKIKL